jgi:hypothetical protein
MIDSIIAAIESLLIGLSILYPEHKEQYFVAFAGLGLVWAAIFLYRFLTRHETLDAVVPRFISSTGEPYRSYLYVVNTSERTGPVRITAISAEGTVLGSTNTVELPPYGNVQLSAGELEGTNTSRKLPTGGINISTAARHGQYVLHVEAKFQAHVLHFCFNGEHVLFVGVSYRKKSSW